MLPIDLQDKDHLDDRVYRPVNRRDTGRSGERDQPPDSKERGRKFPEKIQLTTKMYPQTNAQPFFKRNLKYRVSYVKNRNYCKN